MSAFTPTGEQQAVVDAFGWGEDLVIEAGAGSGKTSTLKLLARAAPGQRGVYIAYNKAIAADAAKSFPSTVTCRTAHGFAMAAVGRQYAHRLNGQRITAQRTAEILGIRDKIQIGPLYLSTHQLGRLITETITRWCYSADDTVMWRHVPIVTGLDKSGQRELARYLAPIAQRAWDTDLSTVDGQLRYTHDHYLKAWTLTKPQLPADYVLLDEAQDSNGCVAGLMGHQDAQRIWVGDRCQAIYGWRGATDAMQNAPGQRLYLSQSFRFGQTIADEANKWLDLLDAPLRLTGYQAIASRVEPADRPDAILCRTNAGAMTRLITALTEGRRPALVGGGTEIRRFAEAARDLKAGRSTSHPDLMAFSTWGEVQGYVEQEADGSDLRVMVKLVDEHGPARIIELVDALVEESRADLVLSTAHKAKGREWKSVRIATDFVEPKPGKDGTVRLLVDECMLAYVAVTRAQRVLDREGLEWIDQYVDGPTAVAELPPVRGSAEHVADIQATAPEYVRPAPVASEAVGEVVDGEVLDAVGEGRAILTDRPGWRPAEPEETPGQLEPELADLPASASHDPCPSCGYLPALDGTCSTCTPAPTLVLPLQIGRPVRYRSDPAGPYLLTVYDIRPSLGVGWVADLAQPDGRMQRSINADLLEQPPAGVQLAFGWPLAPTCRACSEPYEACTCPTPPDRRTDAQIAYTGAREAVHA